MDARHKATSVDKVNLEASVQHPKSTRKARGHQMTPDLGQASKESPLDKLIIRHHPRTEIRTPETVIPHRKERSNVSKLLLNPLKCIYVCLSLLQRLPTASLALILFNADLIEVVRS